MAGLAQSDARTWTAVVAGCSAGAGVGVTLTNVSEETPEAFVATSRTSVHSGSR